MIGLLCTLTLNLHHNFVALDGEEFALGLSREEYEGLIRVEIVQSTRGNALGECYDKEQSVVGENLCRNRHDVRQLEIIELSLSVDARFLNIGVKEIETSLSKFLINAHRCGVLFGYSCHLVIPPKILIYFFYGY